MIVRCGELAFAADGLGEEGELLAVRSGELVLAARCECGGDLAQSAVEVLVDAQRRDRTGAGGPEELEILPLSLGEKTPGDFGVDDALIAEIRIEGVINPIQARYVERSIERAKSEGANLVLLSLDTPGGLVSSMQQIDSALTNSGIPVIGLVEPATAQATPMPVMRRSASSKAERMAVPVLPGLRVRHSVIGTNAASASAAENTARS